MSRELLWQVFNKQTVAQMVSNTLRLAHQKNGSSIKEIGNITGIGAYTTPTGIRQTTRQARPIY